MSGLKPIHEKLAYCRKDNNARPPHIKIRFLPDRKHNDTSITNT